MNKPEVAQREETGKKDEEPFETLHVAVVAKIEWGITSNGTLVINKTK